MNVIEEAEYLSKFRTKDEVKEVVKILESFPLSLFIEICDENQDFEGMCEPIGEREVRKLWVLPFWACGFSMEYVIFCPSLGEVTIAECQDGDDGADLLFFNNEEYRLLLNRLEIAKSGRKWPDGLYKLLR